MNPEVLREIEDKTAALLEEVARLPEAKVVYKWFIDGELSSGGAEEVPEASIPGFVRYWVGQGFYLEQKTQMARATIWVKIWEFDQPEPTWDQVFE